jgi:hypothetical protein
MKSIFKAILKSFFKGINQASSNDFTPQLHHHFYLWVINIILNGILKGIIGFFSFNDPDFSRAD